MGALPHHTRPPAGTRAGRRPEHAPALAAVPSPAAAREAGETAQELPPVLAQAVRTTSSRTATAEKPPPAAAPKAGRAEHAQSPPTESAAAPSAQAEGEAAALVPAEEGRTEAEVQRSIRWLGVTYRPPDVWRERQPSLAEEFQFAMDGSHLPESGPWRAAARAYAAPALALISALHVAIWILRSPARHATAWVLAAVVAITAVYMT